MSISEARARPEDIADGDDSFRDGNFGVDCILSNFVDRRVELCLIGFGERRGDLTLCLGFPTLLTGVVGVLRDELLPFSLASEASTIVTWSSTHSPDDRLPGGLAEDFDMTRQETTRYIDSSEYLVMP